MALFDLLQSFAQRGEFRIAGVLPQASDELDLDLSRLLAGLGILENFLQDLRIHDQRLDIIAHRFDVDVFVDQFDSLRAEGVPEQLAVAAGRLHRFITCVSQR